ncbi:MAG: hypothetical protein ACJ76X_04050 [Solirubrobacteraceae bacterium]
MRSGLGRGTIVQTITITGHPRPATFMFKGTSTAFYSQGTTKGAFTGTGTLHPGGRFTLAATGHYTGGTLYRHVRSKYSLVGTAPRPPQSPPPPPPPPTPACAVPAGSQAVASDAEVIVIFDGQEYRYCAYSEPSRGFQFLARNESCRSIAMSETCATIVGVARSDILYYTTTFFDSPYCNSLGTPVVNSSVYAVDVASGSTVTLDEGGGSIVSAELSPTGVGAWIRTYAQCTPPGSPNSPPRSETLKSVSFRTGAVTTLDTGDPAEAPNSNLSLDNLQIYQCAVGCPANTVVVAWTHDGTWRYDQVS